MSLRVKIVLALTLLAMFATAAIGFASYRNTKRELEATIDRSLDDAAEQLRSLPGLIEGGGQGDGNGRPGRPRSFAQVLYQVIDADGDILVTGQDDVLPVGDADVRVANASPGNTARYDTVIEGEPYRVLTVRQGPVAVQMARSLEESRRSVNKILRSTLAAVIVVAALSALVGWMIARQVTRRLLRLTNAAGVVASTGRLDVDVPTDGGDETGQLGRAFSGMLTALQSSKREQHQLVQDAGHELRTPLTSLRTNVAVLRRRYEELPPDARDQLLADLDSETRELTDLVNELVELATDRRDDEQVQPVQLDTIAARVAERAHRRYGRDVVVRGNSLVDGRPNGIERAMQNLVDNSCKFAPEGPIELAVGEGVISVRDHGPGLTVDDIPHLFDRFYRSVEMRSKPGSGLGLSIVKSVADAHRGTVFARNVVDNGIVVGAELGFTIPRDLPVATARSQGLTAAVTLLLNLGSWVSRG